MNNCITFLLITDKEWINEISLITDNMQDANSGDSIQVQICQNQQCCKTPTLPGKYERGSTSKFTGFDLGICYNMPINVEEDIKVTINTISTDGWKGAFVTIHSTFDRASKCYISKWLDLPESESYESTCHQEGNH